MTSDFTNPDGAFNNQPLGGPGETEGAINPGVFGFGNKTPYVYFLNPAHFQDNFVSKSGNDFNDVTLSSGVITDPGTGKAYGWTPRFGLFSENSAKTGAASSTKQLWSEGLDVRAQTGTAYRKLGPKPSFIKKLLK